jgi:hypothetical protein
MKPIGYDITHGIVLSDAFGRQGGVPAGGGFRLTLDGRSDFPPRRSHDLPGFFYARYRNQTSVVINRTNERRRTG